MTELPNVMRLFLALFLLTIWLTRRTNRTPLYWALAYLAIAAGSMTYKLATTWDSLFLLSIGPLFPGLYVGLFWAGTQHFRERSVRWQNIVLLSLGVAVGVALALAVSRTMSNLAIGFAVFAVMAWSAMVVWKRNPKYRVVAAILFAQGLLLFLRYSAIFYGPVMTQVSGVGYGLLVIGLAYVVLKDSNESIARQATTDDLTGLPNRHVLLDRLDALVRSAPDTGHTSAVLFVDIDYLQLTNEVFGHAVGDRLLKDMAARMQPVAAGQHTLARYGDYEFVFLVSGTSMDNATRNAEEVAQRVIDALQAPFRVGQIDVKPTVSIGIAISGKDGHSADELVQHARLATAQSRLTDRNIWNFCNREMNERAQRELVIEQKLWLALQNCELTLEYQPIVAAGGRNKPVKVEALVRWTNAELGAVPPDEFIRIAERSGLIIDIGQWILEEACHQMAHSRRESGCPLVVCVNVSVRQLRRAGFAESVAKVLAHHAMPASLLELEFTENIMIDDDAVIHAQIRELRGMGVGLSLDDFGTGFSSLSYLTRFDFSTLKIDRSFVNMLEADDRSRRLTESICAIGRSLGLALVAEGVESEYQAAALTGFGVDFMQGFHFSKPMPAEAFAKWFAARAMAE